MTALIIYMILSADHKWEFFALEHTDSPMYCEMLSVEAGKMFVDRPGNMKVLCIDGQESEA
jgi:hypothetical protein